MQSSRRTLDSTALRAVLGDWRNRDLCVVAHHPGWQFNIGFCARLEGVRSAEGGEKAAILDFEGARALTLAPEEMAVSLHTVHGARGSAEWIEARLDFGLVVTIERIP